MRESHERIFCTAPSDRTWAAAGARADSSPAMPSRTRMPVVINARFLTRSPTGVDRFAMELLRAWLPACGAARDVSLLAPAGVARSIGASTPRAFGRLTGHWWEQLELATLPADQVLLNLCNTAPMFRRQQLVVLHDAAAIRNPKDYTLAFRSWYRTLFKRLLDHAKVIASVSQFSADELARTLGRRRSSIEVIYESGEHILRPDGDLRILHRLNLVGHPYVLAVGSMSANKNFGGVARAVDSLTELGIKLVAVGGHDTRVYADVARRENNIVRAGYVTDGELRALYENARCFVFPSFYEGFGLPPLEAMHCGCPVIVSRRASLPEICGEAALYCDPEDPVDIARCIRRCVTDERLRDDLRAAGLARCAEFSWARAARQLEDLLSCQFDGALT